MSLNHTLLGTVFCAFTLVGCHREPAAVPQGADRAAAGAAHDEHDHHGSGPHGGTIAEWGSGDYHVEFTVDHDRKEAVVYVLDGNAKLAAPIEVPSLLLTINDPQFQVELVAKPLAGEKAGASSRFVGQHQNLGSVREFEGTIVGEVNGLPYAGDFKEEAGGHEHQK
jgi:hypothetical protein